MPFSPRHPILAPLGIALALAGCDSLTGGDGGRTRIMLSQDNGSTASLSVIAEPAVIAEPVVMAEPDAASNSWGHGHGTAVLALVDDLDVTITAVQALPAASDDEPHDDQAWETLTFGAPVTVNLLSLPFDEDGLELVNGDLPPGAYTRLRFLVSEASLTLLAPLTFGGHTFPALEEISIRIPNPWISVPGASFTVDEAAGAVIDVVFDPARSIGQLTVSGGGQLTLTPVFRGRGFFDHDGHKDGHEDDDDDDDDDDD